MCDFTLVEFSCGHFLWRVLRWCEAYERTHRRCPTHVTNGEYRGEELCTNCKPSENECAWEHMIQRHPRSVV